LLVVAFILVDHCLPWAFESPSWHWDGVLDDTPVGAWKWLVCAGALALAGVLLHALGLRGELVQWDGEDGLDHPALDAEEPLYLDQIEAARTVKRRRAWLLVAGTWALLFALWVAVNGGVPRTIDAGWSRPYRGLICLEILSAVLGVCAIILYVVEDTVVIVSHSGGQLEVRVGGRSRTRELLDAVAPYLQAGAAEGAVAAGPGQAGLGASHEEGIQRGVGPAPVSTGFYAGTYGIAGAYGVLCHVALVLGGGQVELPEGDPFLWPARILLASAIYVPVLLAHLVYRMWSAIQDGRARTSPANAVALLFEPVYSLYWIFQTFGGFARDYNKYLSRHGVAAPRARPLVFDLSTALMVLAPLGVWALGLAVGGPAPPLSPATTACTFACVLLAWLAYGAMLLLILEACRALNNLSKAEHAGTASVT